VCLDVVDDEEVEQVSSILFVLRGASGKVVKTSVSKMTVSKDNGFTDAH